MEELLSYKQASRDSGLTVGSLRNAASRGRLRTFKTEDGKTLIPRDALREHQEQAEKFTAPNLAAALKRNMAKNAHKEHSHLEFAITFLNAMTEGATSGIAGPGIKFFSVHPELKKFAEPIIQAAMKDLRKQVKSYSNLSPAEQQRWNEITSKANGHVRAVLVMEATRQADLLSAIEQELTLRTGKKQ